MRVSVFEFGPAGQGQYGIPNPPELPTEIPDGVFWQVEELAPTYCMDDRLPGGLAGGSLTPALMMNFINWVRGGEEAGGGSLTYNLVQLHSMGLPVGLHEDCVAMANCLAAVRLLLPTEGSDTQTLFELGKLYGTLHPEAVELPESAWYRLSNWASSLAEGYVGNIQEVLDYVRVLQRGKVVVPEGEREASSLVYNTVQGSRFIGHHLIRGTLGGNPFVVNAHETDELAAVMTDTPSLRREAALVGRLFTLAALSLAAAPHMPVLHLTQGS